MPLPYRSPALACWLIAGTALPVAAQFPAHGTVYERNVRERRMNEHQSPDFTRWGDVKTVIHLDSLQPAASGVVAYFANGDPRVNNRTRGQVAIEASGRIASIKSTYDVPPRRPPIFISADTNQSERFRLGYGETLTFPAEVAWDLIPTFRPKRLVAGERWTDTISWSDNHAGSAMSLRGIRTSRLLQDSVVDGKHYWLVRDTLRGNWTETEAEYQRSLLGDMTTTRDTRGTVTGLYLVDADTRTIHSRDDTLIFKGMATLRYPDGRSFTSPTTFEQTRHIEGFDSVAYVGVLAARRANAPRFSMFRFPTGNLQEQLAAGNVAVRDSVLRMLERSRDVDEHAALWQALAQWHSKNPAAFRDTIYTTVLRGGDTTGALNNRADPGSPPLNQDEMRLMLSFVRDPGRALAYGITIGDFIENFQERLAEHTPAITKDTTRWPCSPALCAEVAQLRTTAKEPRLRELGIAAAFALDPRRYADSVRSDTTLRFLPDLAKGVGATCIACSKAPMPKSGADWKAWLEWMNGKPFDADSANRIPGATPSLRFSDTHQRAMAMTELLTGRKLVAEWQQQLDRSSTPVERYVFEDLLAANRAWHPDPDSVAIWLQADNKSDRARGILGATTIDMAPADSATVTELVDKMLAHVIDGVEPWLSLVPGRGPTQVGSMLDNATRPGRGLAAQPAQTFYVKTPVVTPALIAKWGSRVTFVTDMAWELTKEKYPAAMITIRQVERKGSFASVGADVFSARADSKGINAGAGGNGYLLLLTKDGWKIVSISSWVV